MLWCGCVLRPFGSSPKLDQIWIKFCITGCSKLFGVHLMGVGEGVSSEFLTEPQM
jgi:hypothetical protein